MFILSNGLIRCSNKILHKSLVAICGTMYHMNISLLQCWEHPFMRSTSVVVIVNLSTSNYDLWEVFFFTIAPSFGKKPSCSSLDIVPKGAQLHSRWVNNMQMATRPHASFKVVCILQREFPSSIDVVHTWRHFVVCFYDILGFAIVATKK